MDADCYFVEYPWAIKGFVQNGHDFAIYNWLADEHTEAYVPTDRINNLPAHLIEAGRFYEFSHSLDYYATDQLVCSGAVQFFGNTAKARTLLQLWQETVAKFPGSSDDGCMDYAFNNGGNQLDLKLAWLEKAYARYAWWLYVSPVINHPDFPSLEQSFVPIPKYPDRKRVYIERTERRLVQYVFPKGCLIDIKKRRLLKVEGNVLTPVGEGLGREIWI